jgi:hypothetical protein
MLQSRSANLLAPLLRASRRRFDVGEVQSRVVEGRFRVSVAWTPVVQAKDAQGELGHFPDVVN